MYLREFLEGVESRTVTVGGYRIHYNVDGSKDGLVVVHGLGGRAEDWRNLAPYLAKAATALIRLICLGMGAARDDAPAHFSVSAGGCAGLRPSGAGR